MTETYHVLRTIDDDGQVLTHLPTADRITFSSTDYLTALTEAKRLRRNKYRHKKTGEERVLSAAETDGCAYATDQSVWNFVSWAELVQPMGYAFPVEEEALVHYEPKP